MQHQDPSISDLNKENTQIVDCKLDYYWNRARKLKKIIFFKK